MGKVILNLKEEVNNIIKEELKIIQKENNMNSEEFIFNSKLKVRRYAEKHLDKTDETPNFEVYVVWYCKTLQNHKALLSTNLPDGMYYECTYNGDKNEFYLDAYKKFENICYKIGEEN